MARVAIGLGSNLGDRKAHIESAVAELGRILTIERVSSLYETRPMYVADQADFLNAALIGTCERGPLELLRSLKGIERSIGRTESVRYGPREIDLDLLAYGSLRLSMSLGEHALAVPHPKTPERRFVLAPLDEIAPHMLLPGLGDVSLLLFRTESDAQNVVRLEDAAVSIHRQR